VCGWSCVGKGGCGVGGRGAARVRCGGLLTERRSAPETHLIDIWGWGIGGERGGKVVVNKGERGNAWGGWGHGQRRSAETVTPPHPGPGVGLSHSCHEVSGLSPSWQQGSGWGQGEVCQWLGSRQRGLSTPQTGFRDRVRWHPGRVQTHGERWEKSGGPNPRPPL